MVDTRPTLAAQHPHRIDSFQAGPGRRHRPSTRTARECIVPDPAVPCHVPIGRSALHGAARCGTSRFRLGRSLTLI